MPWVYAILSRVLFFVALPVLLLHPKLRGGVLERLGLYTAAQREALRRRGGPHIWLHGASAGDLLALGPVLLGLRKRFPEATLVVTTLTNSGRAIAGKRLPQADAVLYFPYDLPGAARRAVAALRPDLLILEYTEIWPNVLRAAHRAGAHIALTNGRFSARTFHRYRWLFRLIGNPLRLIDLFLMRGDAEAERALQLGAPLERVWVTGNTKFDALAEGPPGDASGEVPAELRAALGEGPMLIAGSTHDGEEELLLSVLRRLRLGLPELRLVLAPRYTERAPGLLPLARRAGFTAELRSRGAAAAAADVVVLDTMGELSQAYRLATLAFVGGSFTARGGQNILEPAAAGKPVLFGPHMENFADSVQVLVGRGGLPVRDADQLAAVSAELLAQPERLRELGALAKAAVAGVRGASARDVGHLVELLEGGSRADRAQA